MCGFGVELRRDAPPDREALARMGARSPARARRDGLRLDGGAGHRTNLDGSALWQLGLLELWLQTHAG